MDARIRYLAIVSEQPGHLAEFYKTYFSLRELGRSDDGEVALTDGFYNVSIVKPRNGHDEPGLSRLGIEIGDIREVEAHLEDYAPAADIQAEPGGLCGGEYRLSDAGGVVISLSERHFNVPAQDRGLPAIRHVAISVPNVEETLDFYRNVFEFREPKSSHQARAGGKFGRFAADGATALAVLGYPVDRDAVAPEGGWGPRHFKAGVNHFGFLLNDLEGFMARLPEGSVSKRPPRPMAEYRALDPEANEVDLSQRFGYEVDIDVWVRA